LSIKVEVKKMHSEDGSAFLQVKKLRMNVEVSEPMTAAAPSSSRVRENKENQKLWGKRRLFAEQPSLSPDKPHNVPTACSEPLGPQASSVTASSAPHEAQDNEVIERTPDRVRKFVSKMTTPKKQASSIFFFFFSIA
jgi:hypothetical protein